MNRGSFANPGRSSRTGWEIALSGDTVPVNHDSPFALAGVGGGLPAPPRGL